MKRGAVLIGPVNHTDTPKEKNDWWRPYWELLKHVIPGIGLFFVLAIPALGLDFVNQGIEMIEFQRVTSNGTNENNNSNKTSEHPVKVIKASPIVRNILIGVEYLILAADVLLILVVMINGTWLFLKSLKW